MFEYPGKYWKSFITGNCLCLSKASVGAESSASFEKRHFETPRKKPLKDIERVKKELDETANSFSERLRHAVRSAQRTDNTCFPNFIIVKQKVAVTLEK